MKRQIIQFRHSEPQAKNPQQYYNSNRQFGANCRSSSLGFIVSQFEIRATGTFSNCHILGLDLRIHKKRNIKKRKEKK